MGHGVRRDPSGAGPHLLYQALVHAVDGSVVPATDGRFIDEPSSFYGLNEPTRKQETGCETSSAADKACPVSGTRHRT